MKSVKSDTEKVNILLSLASIDCKDTIDEIKYANDARFLAERINWHVGVYKANSRLGNIYFACKHEYLNAAKYYQTNIIIAHDNKNNEDEVYASEQAAKCYDNLGEHKKAIEYFDKVLTLKPDADMQMGVYGDMGNAYKSIADYPHALSSYITSLNLLDSILISKKSVDVQDTFQKVALLLNISDIYFAMQESDKALENYNKVLVISRALKNEGVEVLGLIGVGNIYKHKKEYAKAAETFNLALSESISTNSFNKEGVILDDLANTYLETSDLDKADEYSTRALKIAEEHNYTDQLPTFYTTIGQVYIKQKQYQKATVFLQKALSIGQSTGELEIEQNALKALSEAYEKLNQPAKALEAYQNYIAIRDSVYNIDKANYLTRTDLQYTFDAEKQKQTAAFNEKIARQQALTYCGYGGLVLVLLLAFFMYKNYNTQKKYNALLSKEKQSHLAHISAQDTVLSDIAHTQSHFVRGPIATILGLLQFYNHEDPTDPLNKEIVEGISVSIEKLDAVVKDVVQKENKLRRDTNT